MDIGNDSVFLMAKLLLQNWELIFIDTASTDKTVYVIQKYAEKDKCIRLVRLEKYYQGAISLK